MANAFPAAAILATLASVAVGEAGTDTGRVANTGGTVGVGGTTPDWPRLTEESEARHCHAENAETEFLQRPSACD